MTGEPIPYCAHSGTLTQLTTKWLESAKTRTLPLAIYAALQVPGAESGVVRLASISVLLSLAALVASEMLVRRKGRDGQGRPDHVL